MNEKKNAEKKKGEKNKKDDLIMKANLLKKWDDIYMAHLDILDRFKR